MFVYYARKSSLTSKWSTSNIWSAWQTRSINIENYLMLRLMQIRFACKKKTIANIEPPQEWEALTNTAASSNTFPTYSSIKSRRDGIDMFTFYVHEYKFYDPCCGCSKYYLYAGNNFRLRFVIAFDILMVFVYSCFQLIISIDCALVWSKLTHTSIHTTLSLGLAYWGGKHNHRSILAWLRTGGTATALSGVTSLKKPLERLEIWMLHFYYTALFLDNRPHNNAREQCIYKHIIHNWKTQVLKEGKA